MLNRPARISVDRLLSEKALDLYHFIEKVVRDPERLMIRRKVMLGNKTETILRVVEEENIDLVVLGELGRSWPRDPPNYTRQLRLLRPKGVYSLR